MYSYVILRYSITCNYYCSLVMFHEFMVILLYCSILVLFHDCKRKPQGLLQGLGWFRVSDSGFERLGLSTYLWDYGLVFQACRCFCLLLIHRRCRGK